jgi:hypothetical protein
MRCRARMSGQSMKLFAKAFVLLPLSGLVVSPGAEDGPRWQRPNDT